MVLPLEGEVTNENNIENCTLKIMSILRHPQLKLFILAHDEDNQLVSKIPKKGTLENARSGERNSILVAYQCRMKKNLLEGKQPHSTEEIERCVDPVSEDAELNFTLVKIGSGVQLLAASKLLQSPMWRANAIRLFDLDFDVESNVSEDLLSKADVLLRILSQRFKTYLKDRVTVKAKRAHWSMELAYNNLPVNAAVMALSGHLPMSLECLTDSDCLMVTDPSCYVKCTTHPDRQGAYLHFDQVRRNFARAGKVVGRGFLVRNGEHLKEAKKSIPT